MASIFIPLYILGVVLILHIVKADEIVKTGPNKDDPIPTTTLTIIPTTSLTIIPTTSLTIIPTTTLTIIPTTTAAHTPSANQNSPTVTTLVQPDNRDANLTNNITVGRDGNQSQDQNEDGGSGTLLDDVTMFAMETMSSEATTSQSEESEEVDDKYTSTSSPVLIESTGGGSATAGYVILILILLVTVCLVVVLYILRKKSRKYSFDLHLAGYDHDTPLTCMEQAGTFEPNEKAGGFEYVIEGGGDDHQAMSPVANGSAGEAGSTGENGEKQGHGDSDGDGDSFDNFCDSAITLTPPLKRVGFSLDLDLSDKQSDKSDNGEQNGNNNNVAMGMTPEHPGLTFDPVGPGDVFIEVNLDI
ncbi:uncharacterized protein LOC135516518 [Oncorhynchus masou masou]|uniref:uncharacterized protein LOC135516518 n=1 Tax=Oncorhynchus masou masou TaxID=90313 RepID=UPI0031840221